MRNEQLWQFFVDNTRTPSYVIGDTEAMIAAGRLGEKRFLGLLERTAARPCWTPSRSSSTTASG